MHKVWNNFVVTNYFLLLCELILVQIIKYSRFAKNTLNTYMNWKF